MGRWHGGLSSGARLGGNGGPVKRAFARCFAHVRERREQRVLKWGARMEVCAWHGVASVQRQRHEAEAAIVVQAAMIERCSGGGRDEGEG
jgi:hypothetical protein